jgi:hypothetical protein
VTLKFSAKAHRYWLDGQPIPGVTTLIKGGLPAPALTYWAARAVAEYVADHDAEVEQLRAMGRSSMVAALKETPWTARDRAGIKGTEVHDLAEKLVHGEEVQVPDHLAGYVDSCVRFLDEWKPEPLIVEKPVAHRTHWWAGKPDLIAALPNGETCLFDWKTAASGVFAETAFQLAAYSHAEFWAPEPDIEQPLPEIAWSAAVHLTEDGYSVIPVVADDSTYKGFRHLAFVAGIAKDAKDRLIGKPLPTPDYDTAGAA